MSFEKKMKKRGNDKLNQFAKNPYHQEPVVVEAKSQKSFPLWGKILIPTAVMATALVVFVAVGILPMMSAKGAMKVDNGGEQAGENASYYKPVASDNKDIYGSAQGDYSYAPGQQSEASLPRWEDASTVQRYPDFVFQNVQYDILDKVSYQSIDAQYINQKLGDISVKGYDTQNNETHYINASVYSIKNISDKVSLAILFEGETNYYAYQNKTYEPVALSDLFADTCFEEEATFTSAAYNNYVRTDLRKVYSRIDQEAVMSILYADKSPLNMHGKNAEVDQMGNSNDFIAFNVKFDCLGINNASLWIFSNGRMDINLFGTNAIFNIGIATYSAIKESLDNTNN